MALFRLIWLAPNHFDFTLNLNLPVLSPLLTDEVAIDELQPLRFTGDSGDLISTILGGDD